jgi:hypothetical protein
MTTKLIKQLKAIFPIGSMFEVAGEPLKVVEHDPAHIVFRNAENKDHTSSWKCVSRYYRIGLYNPIPEK